MKSLIFASLIFTALTSTNQMRLYSPGNNSLVTVAKYDTAIIDGTWKLMPVLASDTTAGKIPEINFDLKTNRFSGNTGCNSMSGTFMIKQDALNFNANIITTKMACQGYNEKAFLESLLRTNRYEIKDGVLQLMYNTTVLSKWVRHTNSAATKQI